MIYYSSVGMREEENFSFTFDSKDDFYKWLLNETKYLDGDK